MSYEYDPTTRTVAIEGSGQVVATNVGPEHGLLLAAAPLFKVGCEKIEQLLDSNHAPAGQRCREARELLSILLESFQREEIRALPAA